MQFSKYHGVGNDFLFIQADEVPESDWAKAAEKLCHRQFGIGADGLLVALPSRKADIRMMYFNQDGSVAPMCGNGLRCFGRYVHENGMVGKEVFQVETLAGILEVDVREGYDQITITLGRPRFRLAPPETAEPVENRTVTLEVNSRKYQLEVLFLGTLHAVVFAEETVPEADAAALCRHPFFPQHCNINFVKVRDLDNLEVTTYERGVGYTLACGTGVSASQVVAHQKGLTHSRAAVHVAGGTLWVSVAEDNVRLTGAAAKIAHGTVDVELRHMASTTSRG